MLDCLGMQAKCSCTEETGQAKKTWDEVWSMTDRSFEWILLTLRIVLSGEDVLEKDL